MSGFEAGFPQKWGLSTETTGEACRRLREEKFKVTITDGRRESSQRHEARNLENQVCPQTPTSCPNRVKLFTSELFSVLTLKWGRRTLEISALTFHDITSTADIYKCLPHIYFFIAFNIGNPVVSSPKLCSTDIGKKTKPNQNIKKQQSPRPSIRSRVHIILLR